MKSEINFFLPTTEKVIQYGKFKCHKHKDTDSDEGLLPKISTQQIFFQNLIEEKGFTREISGKEVKKLPVSRFPMIVFSPNLAFFQIELGGTTPFFSKSRKFHDQVVCSFLPLFKKTDKTFGCSV